MGYLETIPCIFTIHSIMSVFSSTFVNIPGLGNSGYYHWQSIWEREYGDNFIRVNQSNWDAPNCIEWITKIESELKNYNPKNLILVGHSVGCATIVNWIKKYNKQIKGVLLVAPSDVERLDYPKYIKGFNPMQLTKLKCKSIVVASSNDHVVTANRARYFANQWGSEFYELENAGHIDAKSGFGEWKFGFNLLKILDNYN